MPDPTQLNLQRASEQLGIKLPGQAKPPAQDSQDDRFEQVESSLYGTDTESAVVGEHQTDSLPPEKKPMIKIFAILAVLLPTLGLGIMILLSGVGEPEKAAKKVDSIPLTEKAEQAATAQEKEIADLKARLLSQQQRTDIAAAVGTKTEAASFPTKAGSVAATPSGSVESTKQGSNTFPGKPSTTKPTTEAAPVTAQTNVARQQAQTELIAARQQNSIEVTAARKSLQTEILQLNSARRARTAESSRVRQLQQEAAQMTARLSGLRSRVASNASTSSRPTSIAERSSSPLRQVATSGYQPIRSTSPTPIPQNWDTLASLSIYGGQGGQKETVAQPAPVLDSQFSVKKPEKINSSIGGLRLPAGAVVPGRLLTPFYTLIASRNSQSLSEITKNTATVVLDRAIEVGAGYSLPVGTTIEFELSVADNGMVQAISRNVIFKNTQIDIPVGAFSITGRDNRPLIATIDNLNSGRIQSAKTNGAIFGVLSEVGKALLQGSTANTVTIGNGATISQTNNGNPNILGAVLTGVSRSVLEDNVVEATALAERLKAESKVAYLTPGTALNIYVNQGVIFSLPAIGQ